VQLVAVTKVSTKYQVVIPKEVREKLGIKIGDKIAWYLRENEIIIKKV